jgi:hypothetical protein
MRHKVGDVVHEEVNPSVGYDVKILKIENTDGDEDKIRRF